MLDTAKATRSPPASPWEEHVLELFEGHIGSEAAILRSYEELAKDSDDESIKYLVGLIVDDERRHHELLMQMLNTIRSEVEWRDVGPRVPVLRPGRNPNEAKLRAHTKQLLKIEKEDAQALRMLRRELRSVSKTTLLSLLVELMEADTAKHVSILKRIESSLRHPLV